MRFTRRWKSSDEVVKTQNSHTPSKVVPKPPPNPVPQLEERRFDSSQNFRTDLDDVRSRLESGRNAARRFRARISASAIGTGASLLMICIVIVLSALAGLMNPGVLHLSVAGANLGIAVTMLAVLPSDRQIVRWLARFCQYAFGVGWAIGGAMVTLIRLGIFAADESSRTQLAWMVLWGGACAEAGMAGIALQVACFGRTDGHESAADIVRRVFATRPDDWIQFRAAMLEPSIQAYFLECGHYYAVPSREVLLRVWRVLRVFWFSAAVLEGIFTALLVVATPDLATSATFICQVVAGIIFTLLSLIPSVENRQAFCAKLAAIGATLEERQAASVASMTGKYSVARALDIAREQFRIIRFRDLRSNDFSPSSWQGNEDANGDELFNKSEPAALGDCDCFFSHSWRDNGPSKWNALDDWAASFTSRHGRSPKLWLDKACIDQKWIEPALAVLPVYLAASAKLVLFVGDTYFSRLWCVMELFTFLRMGGSQDRIVLLTCSEESRANIRQKIAMFDAREAHCFLPEDRDHLLTVIEKGFGNFDAFNELVRGLLVDKVGAPTDMSIVVRKKARRRSSIMPSGFGSTEEVRPAQPTPETTAL